MGRVCWWIALPQGRGSNRQPFLDSLEDTSPGSVDALGGVTPDFFGFSGFEEHKAVMSDAPFPRPRHLPGKRSGREPSR